MTGGQVRGKEVTVGDQSDEVTCGKKQFTQ